jgi:hypothetical protein
MKGRVAYGNGQGVPLPDVPGDFKACATTGMGRLWRGGLNEAQESRK